MTEYVYYIRRGDYIKIGYTKNFYGRMRDLGPDEVLAVEPGNVSLETARHRQFAQFNVPHPSGREWFAPNPELMAHIAQTTAAHEQLEWPPRARWSLNECGWPLPGWGGVPAKLVGVCLKNETQLGQEERTVCLRHGMWRRPTIAELKAS